ncbi:hypothetical protein V5O48_006765 [Marasmius crinis-equi]|uniref:Uncharacterized protein n=1 Tax=Marasmius crinis-equi TaxID=585013 RepID=A0ABR3FIY6_9AGAR
MSLEWLVAARRQMVSVGNFERVVTVTPGAPAVPAQSPPPPPPPYTPTQPYFEPPMAYLRPPSTYECPSCIPMMRPYELDTRPRLSHNVCQFARQRTVSRAFSTNQSHVVQHEYVVERQFTTMTVDPVVIPGYPQPALVPVVPNRAPGTRHNPTQRPL